MQAGPNLNGGPGSLAAAGGRAIAAGPSTVAIPVPADLR